MTDDVTKQLSDIRGYLHSLYLYLMDGLLQPGELQKQWYLEETVKEIRAMLEYPDAESLDAALMPDGDAVTDRPEYRPGVEP